MDSHHPTLDPPRLVLPGHGTTPRRQMGLRRPRLGRILGLGPGRKRRPLALANRHGLLALRHDPGKKRHAQNLEHGPHHRHLHPVHLRHLPHAKRCRILRTRLCPVPHWALVWRPRRPDRHLLKPPPHLAPGPAQNQNAIRISHLARRWIFAQQPALPHRHIRRLLGRHVSRHLRSRYR